MSYYKPYILDDPPYNEWLVLLVTSIFRSHFQILQQNQEEEENNPKQKDNENPK